MSLELTRFTKKLPDARHQFSILIFNDGRYYELKPNYHSRYPSSTAYKKWWEFRYRRVALASDAIQARAMSVLRRAKVKPYDFKYMTTAIRPNNRMRHICSVRLHGGHFAKLWGMGVLRQLHEVSEEKSKGEEIRQMIYGLTPFVLLDLQAAA